MTTPICIGEGGQRLVEARFAGVLKAKEQERFERHLAACAACQERYRRLELAERVAAHGPSGAHESLGPGAYDRVAADLGLHDPPNPRAPWAWLSLSVAGVMAVAAALVLFLRPPAELLIDRGDQGAVSFAVFAAGSGGEVVPLQKDLPLRPGTPLKLRISAPAPTPIGGLVAAFVAGERVEWIPLEAPGSVEAATTVPGVVVVPPLAAGPAWLYLLGAERPLDRSGLEQALRSGPTPEALRAKASLVVVERRALVIEVRP